MRKRLLVVVGIFISINSFASAEEIKKDESTLSSIPFDTACKKIQPIKTKVPFPKLQKLALTTSDVICTTLLFDPDPFGDQVIKAIDKFFIDAAPIFEETFPDTWNLSDISLQKPSVFFQDVHRLAIGKDLTKRGRITVSVGDKDNESVRMDYLDSTKYLSVLSEPKDGEDHKVLFYEDIKESEHVMLADKTARDIVVHSGVQFKTRQPSTSLVTRVTAPKIEDLP